jgi:hypothetical protein
MNAFWMHLHMLEQAAAVKKTLKRLQTLWLYQTNLRQWGYDL